MSKIQCKICHNNITVADDTRTCVCMYCGSLIVLPQFTDENLAALYASAEELYLKKEYKDAAKVYRQIIAAKPDDPAAYWGALLSRFGIAYISDSESGAGAELRPTIKATFSLLQEANYLELLKIVKPEERAIFQQEAERIASAPYYDPAHLSAAEILQKQYDLLYRHLDAEFQLNENKKLFYDLQSCVYESQKALSAQATTPQETLEQLIKYNKQVLASAGDLWAKEEKLQAKCNKKKQLLKTYAALLFWLAIVSLAAILFIGVAVCVFNHPFMINVLGRTCLIEGDKAVGLRYYETKNCVIPNKVKFIKDNAFSNCPNLESVTIPGSVNKIGDGAFSGNRKLQSVVIQNGVKEIGRKAFRNCKNLTSVTIPGSVNKIGDDAFEYSSLQSVVIQNGVKEIGESAFSKCENLTSVTIPGSVNKIGHYAFSRNSKLQRVVIPNGVKEIGQNAFADCKNLTSVTISGSVNKIGFFAFSGNSKLQSVVIQNGVKEIGQSAFSNCENLTKVTIFGSINEIDYGAFERCDRLTSITATISGSGFIRTSKQLHVVIPNDVKEIRDLAFAYSSLQSVVIPNGVKEIGQSAFRNCKNLTSVTIPGSVNKIDYGVFERCDRLTRVTISSGTKYTKWSFPEHCEIIIRQP